MVKIRSLLKLLRPMTLFAPAIGGLFFGLMGIKDAGLNVVEQLPLLFLSGFILAMTNATSNILNQVYDVDIDKKHPKKRFRPIPYGEVSRDIAFSFAIILMLLVIGLSNVFFSPAYSLSLTVILAFAWLYNCEPVRMKKRFVLSNLGISVPRGGLGITCAYSAFASPFNPVMYVAIIYFALYVFGTNTLKDFADVEYDKMAGVKNFVTVWGKDRASEIVALFATIPFMFLILVRNVVPLSIVAFTPFTLTFVLVYLMFRKDLEPSVEGNSPLWVVFYLQFSLMMITFTLPRIL